MAITFVDSNASTPTSSLTSTATVTKPTGLAVGDVMVAFVAANQAGITAPSIRWTRLSTTDAPVDLYRFEVWYCVATSSETAASNFVFTDGDAASPVNAAICAYRGVDTTTPINTSAVSAVITTTSTTQNTPTLTTTQQSLIIYARSCRLSTGGGSNIFTSGTGTERIDNTNTGSGAVNYPIAVYDTGADQAAGSISAVTLTRSSGTQTDSLTTAVALQLLSTGPISANAGVATATAAALDATPSIGAQAPVATATAAAIQPGVLAGTVAPAGVATATAAANDVGMSNAVRGTEVATATAAAYNAGVYYGAPPGRTVVVGSEGRTYAPASESRVYTVQIIGSD